jgi:hypothetical protein
MGAIGTYLQNALLSGTLKNSNYSSVTTVYIGLHTANPTSSTATALSNEVSGNAYVREAAAWGSVSGGSVSTNATITWPQASPSGWGTVSYISIWDGSTLGAGNLLYYGALGSSVTVNATDQVSILSGNLTVTLS